MGTDKKQIFDNVTNWFSDVFKEREEFGKIDFSKIPEDQYFAFYGLLFSASASDGDMSNEELEIIYQSLDLQHLSPERQKKIKDYIVEPPDMTDSLEVLANGNEELRCAIIIGVVEVLLADDIILPEEEVFLNSVCDKLGVIEEKKGAIIKYVEVKRKIESGDIPKNDAEKIFKSAISGLVGAGVPLASIYFAGSVVGFSAAGITSGLAALGLGFGMVSGIGVAVLGGTALYMGLKHVLGDNKSKKVKEVKEQDNRRMQLVIKNLQEVMSNIIEKVKELENKANQSDANREAIKVLNDQLVKLQRILQKKNKRIA